MSVIEQPTTTPFQTVTFDLYRDVHKGIRTELFSVTGTTGNTDPSDRAARVALATHVASLAELLEMHAQHEDAAIQPSIEKYLPDVAEVIERDHATFDTLMADACEIANEAVDASGPTARVRLHQLYLGMASFTSKYLAHQEIEEQVVMPALEREIGVEAVMGIHAEIIASLPPDVMASSLALMIPAMNVDDRTEMLGGMRQSAPPEAFAGIWGLAGSVLPAADYAALGVRLGLS